MVVPDLSSPEELKRVSEGHRKDDFVEVLEKRHGGQVRDMRSRDR